MIKALMEKKWMAHKTKRLTQVESWTSKKKNCLMSETENTVTELKRFLNLAH